MLSIGRKKDGSAGKDPGKADAFAVWKVTAAIQNDKCKTAEC